MADQAGPSDRLDSWKSIADYLSRDVRTARRWENERQLPVHRVPGGGRSAVFAYAAEIDEWLQQRPAEPAAPPNGTPALPSESAAERPLRLSRSVIALAVGAVALVLTVVAWRVLGNRASTPIETVQASADGLTAASLSGEVAWFVRFPVPPDQRVGSPRATIAGAGSSHFVFAGVQLLLRTSDNATLGGRVWRVAGDGTFDWQHDVDTERVVYNHNTYGAPWILNDWVAETHGDARRAALAWRHDIWWPSFVQVLDSAGSVTFRFDNPGWIQGVRWVDPAADRLVVAGASNPHDAGMVALLDLTGRSSQAPESQAPGFRCAACGAGRPLRYVVLPRSEVNRAINGELNIATVDAGSGRISVRTGESRLADPSWAGAEVVYEFDTNLVFQRTTYGDRYWEVHARLEQTGRLHHNRAACPDRDGPPAILVWTPSGGWAEVSQAPAGLPTRGQ